MAKKPTIKIQTHGIWIKETEWPIITPSFQEQLEAFGYAHRTIERLRCSACNKLTMVDDSIFYKFCPNCGAKMEGLENAAETVNKVIAEMEHKFEIGAIIALLRKLLMATWDFNIAHRKHIGVLVEDVLNFLIDAMTERLEKEEKEDEHENNNA